MDDERKRRWTAHCRRMAEATYALADWCEDQEMMGAYVNLGARWIELGEVGPSPEAERAIMRRPRRATA